MVLEDRSKEANELVAVELEAHQVFRTASLHQPHGDEISFPDQLDGLRGILGAEIVFARVLHELAIHLFGQRAKSRSEAFEQRIGLPERPLAARIHPICSAALKR